MNNNKLSVLIVTSILAIFIIVGGIYTGHSIKSNRITGATTATCTSSDGWRNYERPGRTIGLSYDGKTQLNVVDKCRPDGKLQEFDCIIKDGQNTERIEEVNYPNGIDCNSVIPGTECRMAVIGTVMGGACRQKIPTTTCEDSDGSNINNKGTCKAPGYPTVSDGCSPDKTKVVEYTCNQNNLCASEWISCPAGKTCSDGACKAISAPTCTDSDGLNYENYGHVSGIQNGQLYDSWDECTSTMMLKEKKCAGVNPSHIFKDCNTLGKTCNNGKCVTSTSTRSCLSSTNCPTGQVCISSQCTCPNGYVKGSDGVCRKNGKTCSDPDNSWGKTGEKGSVIDTQTSWQGYIWTDYCDGRSLIEFYCDSSDNVQLSKIDCTHGCVNGLCSPQCYDIDGGKNTVVLESIYLNGELKGKDYCFGKGSSVGGKQVNVNYVKEFYCSNNQVVSEDIQSPCPA